MSLYERLTVFLDEHRPMLESADADAHLAVIERLRVLLILEYHTAELIVHEAALSDIPCCECGSRVLNRPEYLRLQLCTMCMCRRTIPSIILAGAAARSGPRMMPPLTSDELEHL